jgi:hypothetical protein
MSYEGYVKALCQNGHQDRWDAYDNRTFCYHCNAPIVWRAYVDQTNCDLNPETGLEWGDVLLEEQAPAVFETCPHCHHSELIEPARYKIPEKAIFED